MFNGLFMSPIIVSVITSIILWAVTHAMVPPMVEVVPNLEWKGLAASLVSLSQFMIQNSWALVSLSQFMIQNSWALCIWPIFILLCAISGTSRTEPDRQQKFVVTLIFLSVLVCVIVVTYAVMATYSMQDQLTNSMGV